eukprot:3600553-Prymnesium_polylepis.1
MDCRTTEAAPGMNNKTLDNITLRAPDGDADVHPTPHAAATHAPTRGLRRRIRPHTTPVPSARRLAHLDEARVAREPLARLQEGRQARSEP